MLRHLRPGEDEKRRPHVWFLTDVGLAEARRAGLAEHRTTSVTGEHVAASPAFAHALAVTSTAIAFSRDLQPGSELGTALGEVGDWEVEVAHPLGAGAPSVLGGTGEPGTPNTLYVWNAWEVGPAFAQ
ncbi:hypothetical protein [Streptomyces sp. NPDC056227]|uniref:hypothetical protein n=1 Tax=Streptomyces sp. NPDC056227 TaxID=3345753 RepID=UPI0035DFF7E9